MTFPTDREAKAFAFARMKAAAPELMDEVMRLRREYGATLTYFKAGDVEYGQRSPDDGWQIDQSLLDRVAGPPPLTAIQVWRNEKAQRAYIAVKAKRGRIK